MRRAALLLEEVGLQTVEAVIVLSQDQAAHEAFSILDPQTESLCLGGGTVGHFVGRRLIAVRLGVHQVVGVGGK